MKKETPMNMNNFWTGFEKCADGKITRMLKRIGQNTPEMRSAVAKKIREGRGVLRQHGGDQIEVVMNPTKVREGTKKSVLTAKGPSFWGQTAVEHKWDGKLRSNITGKIPHGYDASFYIPRSGQPYGVDTATGPWSELRREKLLDRALKENKKKRRG